MSTGPSLPQGKDFDALFQEACESTMREVLEEGGMKSLSWWLGQSGVALSSSSLMPAEFNDALVDTFRPMGAIILEAKILRRFYNMLGAKYVGGDSLSFSDEVERARRLFDGVGDSGRSGVAHGLR